MLLNKLLPYFESSPSLRLLRSPNAPFIIDFFNKQFKQPGRIAVPGSDLLQALKTYQQDLHESNTQESQSRLTGKSEVYLAEWCSRDVGWLQRRIESDVDEHVFQLTPETEHVLSFLDLVVEKDRGFVGTESRLKMIIDALEDLVVRADDDPDARLDYLRKEQQRIERQIAGIENGGEVETYKAAQIRERFATAVGLLKQLQSDFRAVEEAFRGITRQVQQRQIEGRNSRGAILEFALDAEDVLKQDDEGVSFYEFFRFLLTPSQQERLRKVVRQLEQIEELATQREGLETIKRMIPLLLNEAERVSRTNQKLSTALRRLLDARAHRERRRSAQLMQEICGLAASTADDPPTDVGLDLEVSMQIESPFRRSFWSEPQRFETVDLTEYDVDDETRRAAFERLAAMHRLDWSTMRSRVADLTRLRPASTLGDLLEEHPPRSGAVEVLGYLQIARDDGHFVDPQATEEIRIPAGNDHRMLLITAPLVTFRAPLESRL